jgi:CheY-like chemotaxis protein
MNDSLRTVRVLLIEDDADNRDLYAFALQAAGAEVRAVGDGDEALRVARSWSPSVILSDLVMPEVDGLSLLGEIRALAHLKDVPAIAMTGLAARADRDAALAKGFQEHIAKPAEIDHVIAVLRRWTIER